MNGAINDLQLDPRIDVSEYDNEHVYETWESIERLSVLLADQIEDSGESFDHVIIIGRGGFGPGNILARRLGFRGSEIMHIGMNSYEAGEDLQVSAAAGVRQQGKLHVGQLPMHLSGVDGKRGLLIDEVTDTGDSLKYAVELLHETGFKVVKSAVLHWKDTKSPRPDYFAKVCNGWVHYPWEVHDIHGENRRAKRQQAS